MEPKSVKPLNLLHAREPFKLIVEGKLRNFTLVLFQHIYVWCFLFVLCISLLLRYFIVTFAILFRNYTNFSLNDSMECTDCVGSKRIDSSRSGSYPAPIRLRHTVSSFYKDKVLFLFCISKFYFYNHGG